MPVPVRQSARIGWYLARQKLARREKFPLIVELEPLFQCNLACPGCGKIQQPEPLLRQRMPVAQAVDAVMECGAPMVSIAGGEPLIHPEIHTIARELDRAQALRLPLHERAAAGEEARRTSRPRRTSPGSCTWTGCARPRPGGRSRRRVRQGRGGDPRGQAGGLPRHDEHDRLQHRLAHDVARSSNFLNDELRVDQMMIAPAYAYEKAPDQEHFLGVRQTRELFAEAFADGRRKHWRLNHTPSILDFLEGKVECECTAWGIPSYSLFGWQRPCYLMADGYTETYRELIETTDWSKYGRGNDPRCDNCMAHCGYEPTAVLATTGSLRQSLRAMVSQ